MFGLGVHELLIVGLIAVLLFGRKLPEVAKSLGTSYREFRKGLNEFHSQVNMDSYSSSSSYRGATTTYGSSRENEYAEAAAAPKFEPPATEPQVSEPAAVEPAAVEPSQPAPVAEVRDQTSNHYL